MLSADSTVLNTASVDLFLAQMKANVFPLLVARTREVQLDFWDFPLLCIAAILLSSSSPCTVSAPASERNARHLLLGSFLFAWLMKIMCVYRLISLQFFLPASATTLLPTPHALCPPLLRSSLRTQDFKIYF